MPRVMPPPTRNRPKRCTAQRTSQDLSPSVWCPVATTETPHSRKSRVVLSLGFLPGRPHGHTGFETYEGVASARHFQGFPRRTCLTESFQSLSISTIRNKKKSNTCFVIIFFFVVIIIHNTVKIIC